MDAIICWVLENKQWLFSGVGGAIVLLLIGHVINKSIQPKLTQNIQTGHNSTNIQAGRDINIGKPPHHDHVEEGE